MPLHICATPIGNLKDITLRTLETLKEADTIICEDTRVSQKLLDHYGIQKSFIVYNDFQTPREKIIQKLKEGKMLALISDAGTPLVSDPGYKLIQECLKEDIQIITEPGPTAILPALINSGFPPYPFFFGGFFDSKKYKEFENIKATLVFYETAKRIMKTLEHLTDTPRNICVMREITKLYEENITGSAEEVLKHFQSHPPRGEIVLVLSPPYKKELSEEEIIKLLKTALKTMSIKEASRTLAEEYGLSKRDLYQKALEIKN